MDKEAVQILLKRYEEGKATPEETHLVEAWYQHYYEEQLETEIPDEISKWAVQDWKRIHASLHPKRPWVWTAVAASIVFILSAALFFYYVPKARMDSGKVYTAIDLEPGTNKATLITSSGKIIALSQQHEGIVMDQYQISYDNGAPLTQEVAEHPSALMELSTPMGGTYRITLPDGTKVWLNAATTLRYPARFSQQERRVSVQGEAYFEVAHLLNRPFIVESQEQEIKVLGTQFNINTFKDEGLIKTTLVEGKIQLTHHQSKVQKILKPHQQALLSQQGLAVTKVDVNQFIGWKDQVFIYHETSLRTILLELSRWYDFKVIPTEIPEILLSGEIMRSVPLSEVLDMLEKASKVRLMVVAEGAERRIMLNK